MNKMVLAAAVFLVAVVAGISDFGLLLSGVLVIPGEYQLAIYEGKLIHENTIFNDEGKSIVEMTFEDDTKFVATEEVATKINMELGKSYRIFYNTLDPLPIALNIVEIP